MESTSGQSVDETADGQPSKKRRSRVCAHGKIRCKECGTSIRACEHGKERYRCRECGGGGICNHGKIKSICKDCGGSSVCPHGNLKYRCEDCDGTSVRKKREKLLHYGKLQSNKVKETCPHGCSKRSCLECRDTSGGRRSMCRHGKIR